MNLRQHIDVAVRCGVDLHTAVKINYKMGKAAGDKSETDLSQLTKRELDILFNAGLISKAKMEKIKGGKHK